MTSRSSTGDTLILGVGNIGGSMDLAVGAKNVFIAMEHINNNGELKILNRCSYPITAKGVVKKIFTNLAVIDISSEGLVLKEYVKGHTPEDIQSITEPKLIIAPDCKEMDV